MTLLCTIDLWISLACPSPKRRCGRQASRGGGQAYSVSSNGGDSSVCGLSTWAGIRTPTSRRDNRGTNAVIDWTAGVHRSNNSLNPDNPLTRTQAVWHDNRFHRRATLYNDSRSFKILSTNQFPLPLHHQHTMSSPNRDAPPPYHRRNSNTDLRVPMTDVQRMSMEDEERPLPEGWIRQFDPRSAHHFYVSTSLDGLVSQVS